MAIIFHTLPPDDLGHHAMDLERTPQTGKIGGLITCTEPVSIETHYWGGKTIPHDNEHCEACTNLRRKEWHVYLSLWGSTSRKHFLFECTDFAARPLIALFKTGRPLRGCGLCAERKSDKKNAKVQITINEASRDQYQLPPAPDIIASLQLIWRIPTRPAIQRSENEATMISKPTTTHSANGRDKPR